MNLKTTTSLLALLTLTKSEQQALSGVATFVAGIVGQQAAANPDITQVIGALKGEIPPPRWLAQTANWVKTMSQTNSLEMIPRTMKAICVANGFPYDSLVSAIAKLGRGLGVTSTASNPDIYLQEAVAELGERMLPPEDPAVQFRGIVTCPNCTYTFFV
jgi:hypothetical protein